MPPIIKKRVEAPKESVPDIQEIQSMFSQVFDERRHAVLVALGVIALMAALGIGVTVYRSNKQEKSAGLESQALQAFYDEAATKDYTKALSLFEEASAVKQTALASIYTAEANLKAGQTQKAVEGYQNYTSRYAGSILTPLARLRLALIDEEKGDSAKALSALESLKSDPVVGDTAAMEMARIYLKTSQKDKAETLLKEIESSSPKSVWADEAKRMLAPPPVSLPIQTTGGLPITINPAPAAPASPTGAK